MRLNLKSDFSTEDVAALIASKEHDQSRQLRVTVDGLAFLSNDIGNVALDNILFRLETWERGTGYVGKKASQDSEWVNRIEKALRENWPNPESDYIDSY